MSECHRIQCILHLDSNGPWLVMNFLEENVNVGCLSLVRYVGIYTIHAKRLLRYLVLSMKRHVFSDLFNQILKQQHFKVHALHLLGVHVIILLIFEHQICSPLFGYVYQGTVMFWIHGGSYVTGGTKDMFNGTQLAEFGVSWSRSLEFLVTLLKNHRFF